MNEEHRKLRNYFYLMVIYQGRYAINCSFRSNNSFNRNTIDDSVTIATAGRLGGEHKGLEEGITTGGRTNLFRTVLAKHGREHPFMEALCFASLVFAAVNEDILFSAVPV